MKVLWEICRLSHDCLRRQFHNLLGSINWWIKLGSWKAEKVDRGCILCFWLDSIMFLILIKWNFQNFHHQPSWAGGMCERTNFKGSRSSLAVRALANPPLYVDPLVFLCVCWESALPGASRASSDCCCCLPQSPILADVAVEGQQPWRKDGAGQQLCPRVSIWQLREGLNFSVHSNIILHRKYHTKPFPWPSGATVFQRSHCTLNVWVLCPAQSTLEKKSSALTSCFSSGELVFPACRFMMYANHSKKHSCFLPSLSAPSKFLPVNGSTDSHTTNWFGSICQ